MKHPNQYKIRGTALLEYILLIGMIGCAAIFALDGTGMNIASFFNELSSRVQQLGAD